MRINELGEKVDSTGAQSRDPKGAKEAPAKATGYRSMSLINVIDL